MQNENIKSYPKMLYCATGAPIIVTNAEAHALRAAEGWQDAPVPRVDPLAELRVENGRLKAENETLRQAITLASDKHEKKGK